MSRLHQERRRLIRLLASDQELAVGSVARVYRKCGNPRCRCVTGPGHLQTLFLYKDGDKRRCKLIRRADEDRILKAGERYRKWRKAWKRLRAVENRQKQIWLAQMEKRAIRYE